MKRYINILTPKVWPGFKLLIVLIFILLLLIPTSMLEATEKEAKTTHVMCIWTEQEVLKALTIMAFDSGTGKVGILSVPVFTHLEIAGQRTTVGLVWNQEGRTGLKKRLEKALNINIDGHITFDQPIIEKASYVLGSVNVKGSSTTLLQAFEDTRTERRKDDQDVIRAMAANIVSPCGLKKVPQLLWLFTSQVDTDIRPELMLNIYRVISHQGPTILTKKALKGKDYYHGGSRFRYVEPNTWKNIMHEICA